MRRLVAAVGFWIAAGLPSIAIASNATGGSKSDPWFTNPEWWAIIVSATLAILALIPPYDNSVPGNTERLGNANIEAFRQAQNSPLLSKATADLEKVFFWLAGDYDIALKVGAANETRIFEQSWRITITQEMEAKLKQNIFRMIASSCGQPQMVFGQFFTAWPAYKDK